MANADGSISIKKKAALEEVRVAIGAKKNALDAALKKASAKDFQPTRVESYSAQVSNLADRRFDNSTSVSREFQKTYPRFPI